MTKKIVIAILLLAAAAGGVLWWKAAHPNDRVEILASETLARGQVRKVLEQTGIIKSQVGGIVKIGARATGTIERMLVKVGDRVEAGRLVARIDSRELRSQQAEARAGLESARAELKRVEGVSPLRIREAETELEQSRAAGDYLSANYRRLESLLAERIISADELENARQKARVEAKRVEARQAALDRVRREVAEERKKARLAVEKAEAALAAIEVRISYTDIRSPLGGTVSQVAAQEGETIVAGLQVANLITVIDPTRLEMWIYVDETDVGQVFTGQKVEFTVDAYPERTFEGTVATIYPEPEIRDNIVYYQALVEITPEQAEALRPEMTTQVQIVVEEKKDVLRLPNTALKWVQGRQVVFVGEAGGAVRQVSPKLGLAGLTHSEVLEGLAEGDEVATQVDLPRQSARKGSR
ncbi:MAG: efflux transporter periplasmic adaptor subunit [Desulfuromonas sp.]|uniref:efflux RND transporter periplasmic adaptor subunit n=1 Tax=Desulfuromonas sp. TaxID=892 RepID=UPI000CA6D500|nr:efflux RND transporter periplasmic adaptor subunit [Desulfuromonas sp.]PLX83923.1 MAG: efflux transporter periplasmic adaptor subunit [Desulfuromonas sp.]